jgi:glycosyltransferase involved in cell wall biosynthesis
VPALRPARWVLTLHNLPSRMAAQQAAIMPKRRQRWLFGRDVIRARRLERRALSSYDRLVTVSAADAEALGADPKIAVVPNGVDLGRFVPSPLPAAARIVFSGALYTAPNTDAAQWFCRTVLPLVLASVPEVSVDVVGARPPAEVSALSEIPGVSVHADVDSVVPFLEAARVAVVPIRIGSGTRLKALEAWAAGRPVVGTSIGLEGLDVEPGRNAMLADDAPAFAAAVVRVLSDDALARRLAEAGRATVTASYDWAGLGAQLREVLDRA